MKALTLWQPWSWAIAHAGKRVENRTWAPPASVIGQRVAIHAGLRLDKAAAEALIGDLMHRWDPGGCRAPMSAAVRLQGLMLGECGGLVHGAVESVATIAGALLLERNTPGVVSGIVRNGRHGDLNCAATRAVFDSPWRVPGMWSWVLTDVIALPEPVPCRGAQGLWTLPEDVEAAVREQMARAA